MIYISTKLTQYLIKHGIKIEDSELFEFGVRVIIRNMIIFVIALLISITLDFTLSFLFFNFVFLLLRQLTGGYHAKSELVCFSGSMILILFIPYLVNKPFNTIPYNYLILLSLNYGHLAFNEKPYKRNLLVCILFLLDMIYIASKILQPDSIFICNIILVALLSNVIFLIVSKFQKTEKWHVF